MDIITNNLTMEVREMKATLAELKAKQAKELAEFERTEEIKSAYPEAKKIFIANYGAEAWITFPEAETLGDALVIAEKNNPEAIFQIKSGTTTILPETALDKYFVKHSADNGKEENIGCYLYEISRLRGYQTERKLTFYTERNGITAKVSVPIKSDKDTDIDCDITFDRHGNAHKKSCRLINKSGYFTRYIKWWSSEDQPNNFTLHN